MMTLRDDSGSALYDLDAVRAWNRTRPGSGNRGDAPLDELRPTPLRTGVLTDARDGRLRVDPDTGRVDVSTLVVAPQDPPRVARTVFELSRAGALVGPDEAGRIDLSAAGRALLQRFTDGPL